MKFKLPMGVCVLIAIVLVLFGLGYGTFSGFREDRQQVTQLLSGENGLLDALSYQGADGLNLCVVADRHLPGNADVEALRQVSRNLNAGDETLEEQKKDTEKLSVLFAKVMEQLRAADSFHQSERDQRYAAMLESDWKNLTENALFDTYNSAAEDFNRKLTTTPVGKLAGLLGVSPCELYE